MKNVFIGVGVAVAVGVIALIAWPSPSMPGGVSELAPSEERKEVSAGTYVADVAASEFHWAGQKPLLDGYVNSGTIDFSAGQFVVSETGISGEFTLDMNTLHVGLTPKKPGKEGLLEEHMKADWFFDVAQYPTATFVLTGAEVTGTQDGATVYQVTGDLTMKGVTHEVTFPAAVYSDAAGVLHARAETEIDRTKWGLTVGSGNFFEDLGDKVIDDMVALSFAIQATRQ